MRYDDDSTKVVIKNARTGEIVAETIFGDQAAKLCNNFNLAHRNDDLVAIIPAREQPS